MYYDGNYDEDSDLTELEDDDGEDELIPSPPPPSTSNIRASTRPTTKASTAKRQNADKITPRLKKPAITPYPIVHIRYLLSAGRIDLNAEYQRDVVWNEHKQVQLIDSLMHNYYMPPLVFSVISNEDDTDTHVCIDGKQRLTAIQKFLDGQIPHKDHLTHRKLWYSNTSSQKRAVLSQAERDRFDGTLINCVEYGSLSGDDEREIFQRVQLGVALSPAERMLAINSPNAALVRAVRLKLAEHDCKLDRAKGDGTSAATRGRDFQTIAQVLYLINRHISKLKLLEPNSTRVEALLNETTSVSPTVQTALEGAMNTLCRIVLDPVLGKLLSNGRHKLSPVEFVMTGFLLFLYRPVLSLTQLSDAVERMRKNVRSAHRDVRFNSVVYKHILDFVLSVKDMKLKGDGERDVPAAQLRMTGIAHSAPTLSAGTRSGTASVAAASVKRKRADRDDDNAPTNQKKRSKALTIPSAPPASTSSYRKTAPAPSTSTSKPTPNTPSKMRVKGTKPQPKSKPAHSPLFTPSSTSSVSPTFAKRRHGTRDNEAEEVRQPTKARARGRPAAKRVCVESEPEISESDDAYDESGHGGEEDEEDIVVRSNPPKKPKTPASRASVKFNTGKEREGQKDQEKEGSGKGNEKGCTGRTRVKRSSVGSASTAAQASTSKSVAKPAKPASSVSASTLRIPPASSSSKSTAPVPMSSSTVPPPASSSKAFSTTAPCQPPAAFSGMRMESKGASSSNCAASISTPAFPPVPPRPNSRVQTHPQATSTLPLVPARISSTLPSGPLLTNTNGSATPSQTPPLGAPQIPSQSQQSRRPPISMTPAVSSVSIAQPIKSERTSPPSTEPVPSTPASASNPPQPSDSPEPRASSTSRLAPYYAAKELVEQRAQQQAQQEEAQRVQKQQQAAQEEQARRAQAQRAQQWTQQQQMQEERVQRTQLQQVHQEQAQQRQRQTANFHGLPARPVSTQVTNDPRVRIKQDQLRPQSRQQQPQARPLRERGPQQQQHWDPRQYGKDPEVVLHEQLDNIHNSLQPQSTTCVTVVPSARQAGPADVVGYPPSIGRSLSNSRTQGQEVAPLRVDTVLIDPGPSMSPLTPPIVSFANLPVTSSHPISSSDRSYTHFSNDGTVPNTNHSVHTNLARQMPSQPRGLSARITPLSPSSSASFSTASERRMSMDSAYSHDRDISGRSRSNNDFPTRDRVQCERDPWAYRESAQTEWSGDEQCYRPMAKRGGRGLMNS